MLISSEGLSGSVHDAPTDTPRWLNLDTDQLDTLCTVPYRALLTCRHAALRRPTDRKDHAMIIALGFRQLISLVLTVAVVFFVVGVACSGPASGAAGPAPTSTVQSGEPHCTRAALFGPLSSDFRTDTPTAWHSSWAQHWDAASGWL